MAGGKRGLSGMARMPGGSRRRPPPTIDLEAREVESAPAAPPASEAAPAEPAAFQPDDRIEPPLADDRVAEPDAPSPRAETAFERALRTWLPADPSSTLLLGVVAGTAITLLIFLVLWLAGTFSARETADAAPLAARLAALESLVRALPARPADTIDPKAIADELSPRIAALEAALRGRLDDIGARLSKAEAALGAPRPAATDPAVLDRLAAMEAASHSFTAGIADLRQRLDQATVAVRDAQSRADTAAEQTASLRSDESAGHVDALAGRIDALERAERGLDERLSNAPAGMPADRAVRLAFVAAGLRAAVERGTPFAAELAAARSLGADGAALALLEPFAAGGVPAVEALARDLGKLRLALMGGVGLPSREGGFIERLEANAERLVRVRPVGAPLGDEPAAIIVRAEAKASHDDIPGALAELDKLPLAAKTHAAAWIQLAEKRAAAVAAARDLATDSLAALGNAAP